MDEIRIILLCSSRFALPALKELAFFKQLVVVAIPRSCDEMVENVQAVLAGSDIPVLELDKETFADQLSLGITNYKVNMGIVMTFSFKIPASVYSLPAKGFFNIHPGPLPAYRGADPVFQQIRNRETQAGVTIHLLDDGIDTGDIVMKEMIRLDKADTYGTLTSKLALVAVRLTAVLVKLASFGNSIPKKKQNEWQAVYFKKQQAKDIMIDWEVMDANTIVALINAGNPWNKGAVTRFNHQIIRFVEAEKPEFPSKDQNPGVVLSIDASGMTVSTINNEVILIKIVYLEEGFFTAQKLLSFGILPGNQFG